MWYKIWTKGFWCYFWNGRTDVEIKQKTWRHCLGSQFSGRNPPKGFWFYSAQSEICRKGRQRQLMSRGNKTILCYCKSKLKISSKYSGVIAVTAQNKTHRGRRRKKERKNWFQCHVKVKLVQGKKEKKKGEKKEEILASLIKLKLVGRGKKDDIIWRHRSNWNSLWERKKRKKRQHNLASPIKSQFIRGEIRQQSFAVTTQSVNFEQKQNQKTLMPVFQVMVLYKKTTVRGRVRMWWSFVVPTSPCCWG